MATSPSVSTLAPPAAAAPESRPGAACGRSPSLELAAARAAAAKPASLSARAAVLDCFGGGGEAGGATR
eukprot:11841284-Alexandrium_andersonii.AAC.1